MKSEIAISPALIDEFSNIYHQQYDIKLTKKEAIKYATDLMRLIICIENDNKDNTNVKTRTD